MRQTLHNNTEKGDGKAGRESLTENKTNSITSTTETFPALTGVLQPIPPAESSGEKSATAKKPKPNMRNKTNLSFYSFQGFKGTPKYMCVQTLPSVTAVSAPWHLERLCSLRAELFSVHPPRLHTQEMGMNYLFRIWKQQESPVERPCERENNFILKLSKTNQSRLRKYLKQPENLRTIQ